MKYMFEYQKIKNCYECPFLQFNLENITIDYCKLLNKDIPSNKANTKECPLHPIEDSEQKISDLKMKRWEK